MKALSKANLRLHKKDNVEIIYSENFNEPLNGHKIATQPIKQGEYIIKYSFPIAEATKSISKGEHVHVHNTKMIPQDRLKQISRDIKPMQNLFEDDSLDHFRFMGIPREKGLPGIRNYIVLCSTVNCSATVTKAVANYFLQNPLPNIDGVIPITHGQGCAFALGGLGYKTLLKTLTGWCFHPNVVGFLTVELGCEGVHLEDIEVTRDKYSYTGDAVYDRVVIQEVGGTKAGVEIAIKKVQQLSKSIKPAPRKAFSFQHLALGVNCGGSDSLSGLTANPLLGQVSDIIISQRGTTVFGEIPECSGTEAMLIDRCENSELQIKLNHIFNWWQNHAFENHVNLNNNLAKGNITGGLTTIIEKSLGAVCKAGTSPLRQVLDYAEPIRKNGLTIMNTPGYDPVSVTGIVAGGCQLVVFTTGRGSTFGCSLAPTIKIATNNRIYNRMLGDMDFNAGNCITNSNWKNYRSALLELIIQVCNGKKTFSEELNLGWEEFVPWKIGETL